MYNIQQNTYKNIVYEPIFDNQIDSHLSKSTDTIFFQL